LVLIKNMNKPIIKQCEVKDQSCDLDPWQNRRYAARLSALERTRADSIFMEMRMLRKYLK